MLWLLLMVIHIVNFSTECGGKISPLRRVSVRFKHLFECFS